MSLRFLTAGESHGRGLFGILEGLPSGVPFSIETIQKEMARRKLGFGRGERQKLEKDQIEVLSGVRFGMTLGSPICLGIWNQDWENWKDIMRSDGTAQNASDAARRVEVPRPGHADLIGSIKYAHSDMRNVLERSSARETAIRVALGSVARGFLGQLGVTVCSRVTAIGTERDMEFSPSFQNEQVDASPVRCLSSRAEKRMVELIHQAQQQGNTLGGEFEVIAEGLPCGLGSYVQWDRRLEAEIGKSFLSLNAIKGIEIGLGFEAARRPGSEVHDPLGPGKTESNSVVFQSNYSGGIEGGMSTGQTLWLRAAMRPLSTLRTPLPSVELKTGISKPAHYERSDVCAVPAAAVIGESLLALVLANSILEKFGGGSLQEVMHRVKLWKEVTPIVPNK